MKDLVVIKNNQALTDSRTVAQKFDKNHRHVLESIREIIKQAGGVPKIGQTPMFAESTYINEQNGLLKSARGALCLDKVKAFNLRATNTRSPNLASTEILPAPTPPTQ